MKMFKKISIHLQMKVLIFRCGNPLHCYNVIGIDKSPNIVRTVRAITSDIHISDIRIVIISFRQRPHKFLKFLEVNGIIPNRDLLKVAGYIGGLHIIAGGSRIKHIFRRHIQTRSKTIAGHDSKRQFFPVSFTVGYRFVDVLPLIITFPRLKCAPIETNITDAGCIPCILRLIHKWFHTVIVAIDDPTFAGIDNQFTLPIDSFREDNRFGLLIPGADHDG